MVIHCCRALTRTQVFCKAYQFFSLHTVFWYRSVPEDSNEHTLIYINKRHNARCRVILIRKTQPLFMWNLFSTDYTARAQFSWPQDHKREAPKPSLVVRQAFTLLLEQWQLICLNISRYKYIFPESLVFLFVLWLASERNSLKLSSAKRVNYLGAGVWRYSGQGCRVLRIPGLRTRDSEDATVYFWCILWVCFMLSSL